MSQLDHIGQALRLLRTERGLTQTELHRLTGIASSQLSRYEVGGIEPSLRNLVNILEALHVGFGELESAIRRVQRFDAESGEAAETKSRRAIPFGPRRGGKVLHGDRRAFLLIDVTEEMGNEERFDIFQDAVVEIDDFLKGKHEREDASANGSVERTPSPS